MEGFVEVMINGLSQDVTLAFT